MPSSVSVETSVRRRLSDPTYRTLITRWDDVLAVVASRYHVWDSHLAKAGTQVVVPYRDEDSKRHLRVMGDLGQIVPLVGSQTHILRLVATTDRLDSRSST